MLPLRVWRAARHDMSASLQVALLIVRCGIALLMSGVHVMHRRHTLLAAYMAAGHIPACNHLLSHRGLSIQHAGRQAEVVVPVHVVAAAGAAAAAVPDAAIPRRAESHGACLTSAVRLPGCTSTFCALALWALSAECILKLHIWLQGLLSIIGNTWQSAHRDVDAGALQQEDAALHGLLAAAGAARAVHVPVPGKPAGLHLVSFSGPGCACVF